MKKFIIGTAGHIDHGKTSLIKALTGKNTDNLKEELSRGISINLGFTYFDLGNGNRAGVIDVPGHERFIKNMIAGACGVDVVLLVISASEGIMPQTVEHVEILSHLDIKNGIIVLTMCDIVDEETKALTKEMIQEQIVGTMFENAEIIEVDSISGRGIDKLKKSLVELSETVETRDTSLPARLNIDRSFSVKGHGTVVTGTLAEGIVELNDELVIYPLDKKIKVRNIQVHDTNATKAFAGQRVALNISDVKSTDIKRGHILSKENSLIYTEIINAEITVANDFEKIKMWDRVRVYTGTSEVLARFVPINTNELKSNETGFVQLRLEHGLYLKRGDKLVLRLFSPLVTIGGGVVIDPTPKRHKNLSDEEFEKLSHLKTDQTDILISNFLKSNSSETNSKGKITTGLSISSEDFDNSISNMIANKSVVKIGDYYLDIDVFNSYIEETISALNEIHKNNKLKAGVNAEELRKYVKTPYKLKDFNLLINEIASEKVIKVDGGLISLYDFEIEYSKEQQEVKDKIEKKLLEEKFSPSKISEIIELSKANEEVVQSITNVTIIRLDKDIYIHADVLEEAKDLAMGILEKDGKLTLADFRNATESSRKYALLILDYFDGQKITRRVEDYRVKY